MDNDVSIKTLLLPPLHLSEVAKLLGGTPSGDADPVITGAAGLKDAGPGDLSFVADAKRLAEAQSSAAGALLIAPGMEVDRPAIAVDSPHAAFAVFLRRLEPDPDRLFPPGRHATAVIDPTADVAAATSIGPYCVVGPGVVLGAGVRLGSLVTLACDVQVGRDSVLHAQVAVRERCSLGERVVVHSGTVIGSDGFGYLPGAEGMIKVPQVGIVEVQDDVEIGASCTLDRATTGRTVIGAGSKLDNQVHIAHNVSIGRHCALSAQFGVAGSTTVGDGVVAGGQVGISDHVRVGNGVRIGAKTGVLSDVAPGGTVLGFPAQDIKEYFRVTAALRRLPDVIRRLRRLENSVPEARTQEPGTEPQGHEE